MIASGDPERTPNPVCPAKVAEMVKAGDALHNPVAAEANLFEEPGAGNPHAGICAGAVR